MMKYTWLVEKYLEGELEGEELRNFELEILRNPEIAEEIERIASLNRFMREQHKRLRKPLKLLEDYKDTENVIDEELIKNDFEDLKIKKISSNNPDYIDFKEKIKAASDQYIKIRKNNKHFLFRQRTIWLAAASLALLLSIGSLILFQSRQNPDPATLYSTYYQPYLPDILIRDITQPVPDPFLTGLYEYHQANYEKALQLFDSIADESGTNNAVFLFRGICYMELEQHEKAITSFNRILNDRILKDYARWYTGLSYLKLNKIENARSEFQVIVDSDGYYKSMAEKILKTL